jgi:hypothetical protein
MKRLPSVVKQIAVAAVIWLLVLCLPLIPTLRAPVIPDPVYEATLVSIFQLVASLFLVGIRLQATWLTLPVAVGLIAIGIISVRFVNRRFFPRREGD